MRRSVALDDSALQEQPIIGVEDRAVLVLDRAGDDHRVAWRQFSLLLSHLRDHRENLSRAFTQTIQDEISTFNPVLQEATNFLEVQLVSELQDSVDKLCNRDERHAWLKLFGTVQERTACVHSVFFVIA